MQRLNHLRMRDAYGQPYWRNVYQHRGQVVYVDLERYESWNGQSGAPCHVEVFVPLGAELWCIGTFYPSRVDDTRTWAGIERQAERMVEQWADSR